MPQTMEKCYPAGTNRPAMLMGYALLAAGVIVLFICIPCWAWVAVVGVGLIALGWLLIKLSNAWR